MILTIDALKEFHTLADALILHGKPFSSLVVTVSDDKPNAANIRIEHRFQDTATAISQHVPAIIEPSDKKGIGVRIDSDLFVKLCTLKNNVHFLLDDVLEPSETTTTEICGDTGDDFRVSTTAYGVNTGPNKLKCRKVTDNLGFGTMTNGVNVWELTTEDLTIRTGVGAGDTEQMILDRMGYDQLFSTGKDEAMEAMVKKDKAKRKAKKETDSDVQAQLAMAVVDLPKEEAVDKTNDLLEQALKDALVAELYELGVKTERLNEMTVEELEVAVMNIKAGGIVESQMTRSEEVETVKKEIIEMKKEVAVKKTEEKPVEVNLPTEYQPTTPDGKLAVEQAAEEAKAKKTRRTAEQIEQDNIHEAVELLKDKGWMTIPPLGDNAKVNIQMYNSFIGVLLAEINAQAQHMQVSAEPSEELIKKRVAEHLADMAKKMVG